MGEPLLSKGWIPAFAGMTVRSKLQGIRPHAIKNKKR